MKKLSLSLILLVLGISSVAAKGKFEKYVETCRLEHNKTFEEIEDILDHKLNLKEYDEKVGCFLHCFGEKAGYYDDNGKLVADELRKMTKHAYKSKVAVEKEKLPVVDAKIKYCQTIDEGDACVNAFKVNACLNEHRSFKKRGFLKKIYF